MAATLTAERFIGPDWIFERKYDGIRLLAFKDGRRVRLLSRNRLPQESSYPTVVDAVAALPVNDVVLDGEATGVWGKPGKVTYHVFDILWRNGRDLASMPLEARHTRLDELPLRAPLARVAPLSGPAPWETACREGWEGVIAKRRGSVYEHRRSKLWLKMKCEATQELVVGGFTNPRGGRVGLGALLVGYFDDGAFRFAGKVGTGFNTALLTSLRRELDALEIPRSPFGDASGLPRLGVHWVRPKVVVQVAFTEWTVHGKLRHPRLVGRREDKRAEDVVRERPAS
jgi:bifunctional non-homologous end joining protein LigD